ncbi:MAG: methyltransferase domain-containing protein [Parachlamydiaceae bacterium]|nr:methyltransferase domain-containing protein [Parachlamydiaceae bacterium]
MLRTLSISLLSIFFHTSLFSGEGISLADNYQKNSGLQWEWAIESLKQFSFSPNDKVLDVGCGDGKITALIAQLTPQGNVVGMDISENMINQATSNFKNDNIIFIQGNAIAIPFTQQFDKVVSFCTLHWVLDQKQALTSMKNSLKKRGMMLLILPAKAPNNIAIISEEIASSRKWSMYFPVFKKERIYFTADEYKEILKETNLTIQSMLETESITFYKNKAALIDWIKPLVNFIDHLEYDLQMSFIEDIADQMILNDLQHPDGSIQIRHLKIEVVATKT